MFNWVNVCQVSLLQNEKNLKPESDWQCLFDFCLCFLLLCVLPGTMSICTLCEGAAVYFTNLFDVSSLVCYLKYLFYLFFLEL